MKKSYLNRVTKRLIVRPLEREDFDTWKAGFLSFGESKNPWDHGGSSAELLTRANFAQLLRDQKIKRKNDHFYNFAVFERSTGAFIGSTALMDVSRALFQNAYIGYWIGNTHWGQGFGHEAVDITIDIAFRDLNLHRVEAGIHPKNRRSIALARALGMRREGVSRRRLYLKNVWQDMVLYALTSEERGLPWTP